MQIINSCISGPVVDVHTMNILGVSGSSEKWSFDALMWFCLNEVFKDNETRTMRFFRLQRFLVAAKWIPEKPFMWCICHGFWDDVHAWY